jgi:hypothetical protein
MSIPLLSFIRPDADASPRVRATGVNLRVRLPRTGQKPPSTDIPYQAVMRVELAKFDVPEKTLKIPSSPASTA